MSNEPGGANLLEQPVRRGEWREEGICTNCGTPVTVVHESDHPTCRRDGMRFIDARFPDRGWCLFRCKECHAVINSNWAPKIQTKPGYRAGPVERRVRP